MDEVLACPDFSTQLGKCQIEVMKVRADWHFFVLEYCMLCLFSGNTKHFTLCTYVTPTCVGMVHTIALATTFAQEVLQSIVVKKILAPASPTPPPPPPHTHTAEEVLRVWKLCMSSKAWLSPPHFCGWQGRRQPQPYCWAHAVPKCLTNVHLTVSGKKAYFWATKSPCVSVWGRGGVGHVARRLSLTRPTQVIELRKLHLSGNLISDIPFTRCKWPVTLDMPQLPGEQTIPKTLIQIWFRDCWMNTRMTWGKYGQYATDAIAGQWYLWANVSFLEQERNYTTHHCIMVSAHMSAVYTRENKPRIRQSAAYLSRELSHLYKHGLYKKLVRVLRKPRTSFLCRLHEQFVAYISRGLCNPRLIFPRINRTIDTLQKSIEMDIVAVANARISDLSIFLQQESSASVPSTSCQPTVGFQSRQKWAVCSKCQQTAW